MYVYEVSELKLYVCDSDTKKLCKRDVCDMGASEVGGI